MGEIFRARQLSIGREVALKILNPELARRDPQFATKFVDEARAAGRLNHPNIVAVHDVGRIKSATSDEYLHYFSMEFVDGENLREVIDREGTCPQPLVEKVMLGMADALVYAEAMNMLHRDIKPENIMVTGDGRIKLADFGLAQEMDSEGTQADRDEKGRVRVMGTPRYMSPEQARGRPLDARSDQYSLGATLYHLLTGTPPYRRESGRATMKAHVSDPVPDPGELVRVSPAWRSLCMRLMAKSPEERFATAAELKQAVEQAISGRPLRAQNLRSRRQEPPTESPSKGPGRALILVAGAMVVFAAGAFFFAGGDAFDLISEQNSSEEDGGETSDHALAQQRAEDIISSLPADLDVAIAHLNAALANPYFQSAPSAQAMLANHLAELRMQRQERDQALQEQRQQLRQRLLEAQAQAQAHRFQDARGILASFRQEDRQMVDKDFTQTRESIQGLLVARYEYFAERMDAISDADAGAVLLAEAGAEGLPTSFLSRLENARDERVRALEEAITARQAEAQRMVEQRLDTMFEVLGRLRGDGAERIPQFDRFTRLASDYRNRFSEPDLQELCASLVRIAQLAQALHGRVDGFLRVQQPVITLNFGTGPTQARVEGLEGATVSLLFSRSGARTRRSLADPEIDHAHLAKLAQEHLSLSQDHLAAYLWMWGLENSPNFSDGALSLAAQRFSGHAGNESLNESPTSGDEIQTAAAGDGSPTLP
ncbi:MAG: serine/threonine protein kinase, partial [Planctomycetota bacterium]